MAESAMDPLGMQVNGDGLEAALVGSDLVGIREWHRSGPPPVPGDGLLDLSQGQVVGQGHIGLPGELWWGRVAGGSIRCCTVGNPASRVLNVSRQHSVNQGESLLLAVGQEISVRLAAGIVGIRQRMQFAKGEIVPWSAGLGLGHAAARPARIDSSCRWHGRCMTGPMRMITKGRFAVIAMMDLALSYANGPVALKVISSRQGISLSYLDQLFSRLRSSGLVDSVRGPAGGYTLARDAASISVADIVAAVDGPDDAAVAAVDRPGAQRAECVGDAAREVWHLLNLEMGAFLGTISLESLVDVQRTRAVPAREVHLHRGISPKPVVLPIRTNAPNSVFALAETLRRHAKAS